MVDFFLTLGIFTSKILIVLFLIGVFFSMVILSISEQKKNKNKKKLIIIDLGKSLQDYCLQIQSTIFSKKTFKQKLKDIKKKQKSDDTDFLPSRVYVLKFKGDIQATQVQQLREEISILLKIANPKKDEIILKMNNGGGAVYAHGLGASQLQRLRDAGFKLTVCIDEIAASGGYLMACVADQILAAPFSIIGSIGVIAQMPNFHRFLQKQDVDYEEHHAGKHKRTLTIFGKATPEKREKLQQQLEEIHKYFKSYVVQYRKKLKISEVATGEYWLGTKAKELGLIDKIITSDEYIFSLLEDDKKVYQVSLEAEKPKGLKRLFSKTQMWFDSALKWIDNIM